MTVTRFCTALGGGILLLGCGAERPETTGFRYQWPERLAWRIDYVSETQRQAVPLVHYAESKTLRAVLRDGRFVLLYDSVLRSSQDAQGVHLVPLAPEDTLAASTTIGELGEISAIEMGCDPALPECADAVPSALLLELRRIVPRLTEDWLEPGRLWEDTLEYDDVARRRGARGSLTVSYSVMRDSTVNGVTYALVTWRAVRRTFRPAAGGAITAETPVQEQGITFIDRARRLPVFSSWSGAVPAPPELRAAGATGTVFRGRAYLSGTVFDSLYSQQVAP